MLLDGRLLRLGESRLVGCGDLLVDKRDDLLTESLAITLSFDLHREELPLLDANLLPINKLGRDLRHQLECIDTVEHRLVVDLLFFESAAH